MSMTIFEDTYNIALHEDGTALIELSADATRLDLLEAIGVAAFGVSCDEFSRTYPIESAGGKVLNLLDSVVQALSDTQARDVLEYVALTHNVDIIDA